ncbi:unnamed protein product, partial [Iphiclides podalirius]
MPRNVCCVLGCPNKSEDGVPLHYFPNPEIDSKSISDRSKLVPKIANFLPPPEKLSFEGDNAVVALRDKVYMKVREKGKLSTNFKPAPHIVEGTEETYFKQKSNENKMNKLQASIVS